MATGDHADDITRECWDRNHAGCSGYTEPESDPELCNCRCHDDLANQIVGDR